VKYIVLETKDGARLPIIFPEALTHSFVAGAMQLAVDALDPKKDLRGKQCESLLDRASAPVVSAGFVQIDGAHVHGTSESLGGVKYNNADAARIILGDAIQFMPDDLAMLMLAKLNAMKGHKT
jgi:hypothetical protein